MRNLNITESERVWIEQHGGAWEASLRQMAEELNITVNRATHVILRVRGEEFKQWKGEE